MTHGIEPEMENQPPRTGSVRRLVLNIHLYAGIVAAGFLVLLGVTGAILAFDSYYDQWVYPSLWRVIPQGQAISDQDLADMIERRFAPARVEIIDLRDTESAILFRLSNGLTVFVDPFKGTVLGTRDRAPGISRFVASVRRLHAQLGSGYAGRRLVDTANVVALVSIALGVFLWWEKKRLTVDWKYSWSRINWDLHSVAGIYSVVFLAMLSVTGFFLGSEESLYRVVRSEPQPAAAKPHSVPPGSGEPAPNIGLNRALQTADLSLPGLRTAKIRLPLLTGDTYVVEKRVPDWSVGGANSAVYIDQYSGQPLRVDDVRAFTRGFRAYRLNSALHTGASFGLAGRIILSISSLVLALLVVTGILIWIKKQGWMNSARKSHGRELVATGEENLEMSGERV